MGAMTSTHLAIENLVGKRSIGSKSLNLPKTAGVKFINLFL